ncbi:Lrp/AsnC family transcriptional regulator [Amycolatopsis sp. WQ 127309]|uniref:Lrp/AsnC family transcriptional regulator n=1 Tax=Amycolatopsis sp. WQ 127309 TaxID=2932773 RepID=UPI001FF1FC3E|nr:AsnC family transcriptional regulator [Amycolatopsis sp. WQ 127309]UOZ03428.1 Lrp/AsnC family transcriptional regulator [Amycolatopsis sp. WQ 127309]
MEAVDHQIVQCLLRDGRAPFRRIADVLGVSEQTVARRYRALRANGVLRVQVLANERALGLKRWFVRIQCRPDAAEALAEVMAAREDVSWVSITSGGSEIICVAFSDPSRARGSVLHRLPRTSQVLSFTAFAALHMHVGTDRKWMAFDSPLGDEQLSKLCETRPRAPLKTPHPGSVIRDEDAALFAELAKDGRAGAVALARATGWPQSRVSARLEELLSTGTAHVSTDLAPQQFGFDAVAYLWLTVTPSDLDETGKELSLQPETTFTAAVTGMANLLVTVTCRDLDALYTFVTTKVGTLSGVRQVEVVPVLHRLKQAGTRVRDGRLVVT